MNQMNNSKLKEEKAEEEDEDDDGIIINDDIDEDSVVVKSMIVEIFKNKALNEQKEDQTSLNEVHRNTKEHQRDDTKDVESELPFDSKLVYQYNNCSSKEEYDSRIKLTIDEVQSDEYQERLLNQNRSKDELKTQLTTYKDENINVEAHTLITSLLLELEAKNRRIHELEEMTMCLNQNIENSREEIKQLHKDIDIKRSSIEELISSNQKKQKEIEQHEKKFQEHISNTKTISACNKSLLKIEKQLAIAFDQINRLTNENFFLKQTIHKFSSSPYGKPKLSLTNQVSLDSTLTTNPTNEKDLMGSQNNITSNSHIGNSTLHEIVNQNGNAKETNNGPVNPNPPLMNLNRSKSTAILSKQSISNKKKVLKKGQSSKRGVSFNSTNSNHVKIAKKERTILGIESTLYKLQRERDKLNDELAKIPEFPKLKAQLVQKKSLELSIDDYNNKIQTNKQKLVEINSG